MVRFARAHGSKSSNERQPEEATPWKDIQQQRLVGKTTTTNLETFDLNKIKACIMKPECSEPEWADIEDHPVKTTKKGGSEEKKVDKNPIDKKKKKEDKLRKKTSNALKKQDKKDGKKLTRMLKKLKLGKNEVNLQDTCTLKKKERKSLVAEPPSKRKKRKEKVILKMFEDCDDMTVSDIANATHVANNNPVTTTHTLTNKQKRRIKHLQKKSQGEKPVLDSSLSKAMTTMLSKRQKRNKKRLAAVVEGVEHLVPNKQVHKRRKPEVETSVLNINGQDVEVSKFDGFPVRKQDADRLNELRQQLIENKIPLKEMKLALKMERRKAEKAWAREKKNVCFQCRKSGHNLSECPDLVNDTSTVQEIVPQSGICYKCGSTEHTHFECRVNRSQDFRFATCFICKEQGHISNQCPDNPRGLYPKGGACKVCGDVTHLKKDCPDLMSKKEEQNVTVSLTNENDNLEMLDEDLDQSLEKISINSVKKTIKF